jgi:hypothetical protein
MLSAQKIFLILGVFLLIVDMIAGTPVYQVVFKNLTNRKTDTILFLKHRADILVDYPVIG